MIHMCEFWNFKKNKNKIQPAVVTSFIRNVGTYRISHQEPCQESNQIDGLAVLLCGSALEGMEYFPNESFLCYLLTVTNQQVLVDFISVPNWPPSLLFLLPCLEPDHILAPFLPFHLHCESMNFHPDSGSFLNFASFKSLIILLFLCLLMSLDFVHAHLSYLACALFKYLAKPARCSHHSLLCVSVAYKPPICILNQYHSL